MTENIQGKNKQIIEMGNSSQAQIVDYRSWKENGLTYGDLDNASVRISQMIDAYNQDHHHEMLPKPPELIREQFMSGRSAMLYDSGQKTPLAHGCLYPSFENGENEVLGLQVVEDGSVIVHPDYRGQGYGTHLNRYLKNKGQDLWGDVLVLATIKQIVTARSFDKSGYKAVNFWEYPYLASLTCSCEHCSEHFHVQACEFRRPSSQSTQHAFENLVDRSRQIGAIPCTLVVSDPNLASQFEARCRELDIAQSGRCLVPGEITSSSMAQARGFFENLKQ